MLGYMEHVLNPRSFFDQYGFLLPGVRVTVRLCA